MVPHGDPTQQTVDKLAGLLDAGDLIVDGGNSNFHDDAARAAALEPKGIHYVDVGTSGGVWGLQEGYCMMVGGPDAGVAMLAPILDVLAPPDGWRHFGGAGAGHYVKMVHNGVEYGIMQAYAEGFELMHKSDYGIDLAEVAGLWNRGSVVRSWLCELAELAFRQEGNDLAALKGPRVGLRRGALDDPRRDRQGRADAGDHRVFVCALLFARRGRLHHRVLAALRNQFGGHAVEKVERGVTEVAKPARRGARAAAGPADQPGHLRRHRRPVQAQAAAGDLQPRARGRAARAVQPDRRIALGHVR